MILRIDILSLVETVVSPHKTDIMTEGKQSVCVFKGSLIEVNYYKERLEELDISSFVKDDFQTGIHAGFIDVSPDVAELIVDADDAEKAIECIRSLKE